MRVGVGVRVRVGVRVYAKVRDRVRCGLGVVSQLARDEGALESLAGGDGVRPALGDRGVGDPPVSTSRTFRTCNSLILRISGSIA